MASRKRTTSRKPDPAPGGAAEPRATGTPTAPPRRRILVVDDQEAIVQFVSELAGDQGHEVVGAASAEEGLERLGGTTRVDAVILDLNLGPEAMDGMQALPLFRARAPGLPIVMLTGEGSIRRAVSALHAGASDFIEKNDDMGDQLEAALLRLQRTWELLDSNRDLAERVESLEAERSQVRAEIFKKYRMIGSSPALRQVVKTIEEVGPIPRPVLIRGERGTGKELVAAALHRASPRSGASFQTINCAAFAEGLLECEMFGQEEGGYTDAKFRKGRFELAHKGTLFLDEVGNMPLAFQEKMLRVLEYQEFSRVGGSATVRVDVRVIAATNSDLEKAMADGKFRPDLYDRLAFETLRLPPLRERKEDLPALAEHFLGILATEVGGPLPTRMTPEFLAALEAHDWPGNVREFKNYIERVAYRAGARNPAPEALGREHLLPMA